VEKVTVRDIEGGLAGCVETVTEAKGVPRRSRVTDINREE